MGNEWFRPPECEADYVPPEDMRGDGAPLEDLHRRLKRHPRVDVTACCALLHYLLDNSRPRGRVQVHRGEYTSVRSFGPDDARLYSVLSKGLSAHPLSRYQSCEELLLALKPKPLKSAEVLKALLSSPSRNAVALNPKLSALEKDLRVAVDELVCFSYVTLLISP